MNLTANAGQVSNFNFTITINNDGYNKITNMVTLITVEDFETGEILFDGRIYDNEENMDSNGLFYKDVSCESELTYLNDTIVRNWNIENMSVQLFLQQIIDNHNSKTSLDKQFVLGNIEYNNTITCQTKYENTLNCIISNIVNAIGEGYLRVRKVNDIRYLDYIQLYSGQSDDIILGQNMKDLKWKKDMSNIITRVVPIGKDGLTISDVNNGLDYLDNPEAIGTMGIIEGKLELNDIDDANTLKTTAQDKLPNLAKSVYQLASNTLDLSKLGINPFGFSIGTDVNIIADAINFNDSYTIIVKETDLLDPAHVKITLDNKFASPTNRQLALQRYAQILQSCLTTNKNINTFSLEGIIDTLKNQITSSGSFTNAQVIENKGILVENTNAESNDYGALYLGCGILAIANSKTNGQWNWRSFGTGNGFTANLMIAGTMLADRIKGGTFTAGGNGNGNGTIVIKNSLDKTVTILNNEGIKVYNDNEVEVLWVDNNTGNLTCNSLDVIGDGNNTVHFKGIGDKRVVLESDDGGDCSILFKSNNYGLESKADIRSFTDSQPLGNLFITARDYLVIRSYESTDIENKPVHTLIYGDIELGGGTYVDGDGHSNNDWNGQTTNGNLTIHGNGTFNGNVTIGGDLGVIGNKQRIVQTDQGHFAMNAIESPDCEFVLPGRGLILNGECVVTMDSKWLLSVNTEIDYDVQVSAYGNSKVWVDKNSMTSTSFKVCGDADVEFMYRVYAKQKGYENTYMETVTVPEKILSIQSKINKASN